MYSVFNKWGQVKTENPDDISKIIHEYFKEDTYENAEGGLTTKKVVAILDIFELVDHLEKESLHLGEVYSRFLIFDEETTAEEVIKKHSLDK
ncbi:DUF4288 domain-containing protein [Bacillus sp. NPDC077027]|uniref:DUF4288 domain-containing protein n=1 Tax=Bacillus sp. NPDC077027 TaxID=3390548 RepID=UPI003D0580AE